MPVLTIIGWIIIGFLASVIGLGGIGEKVRKIVQTLQKPVTKAVDFLVNTGLKLAGPLIRGIAGISGKVKAKVKITNTINNVSQSFKSKF